MRRLRHFFCSCPSFEKDQEVLLARDETRHLQDVLRLAEGDPCFLSNGHGGEAEATILGFSAKGETRLKVNRVFESPESESLPKIKVFFALPKKGKSDTIIEKLQEVGISAAYPLKTKRTILKISAGSKERVLLRWRNIIKNAAKQSRSSRFLEIHAPQETETALSSISSGETILVLHPAEDALLLRTWIESWKRDDSLNPINIFIGPEGGFTEDEVLLLENAGAEKISLGESILRVETAVVSVAACLKFMLMK